MMHKKIIKVCGMTNGENIRAIEQSGADMIGFIFYPKSPRYLHAPPSYLPNTSNRVGVFVNETETRVQHITERFRLDYIQLHGNESPEYCNLLQSKGLKVIKAFAISQKKELEQIRRYEGCCNYYLFDTKCKGYGGSGTTFNWNILLHYNENTPFLLSGGISPWCIKKLNTFNHPQLSGYDINSCFETSPGKKDVTKVSLFIKQIK